MQNMRTINRREGVYGVSGRVSLSGTALSCMAFSDMDMNYFSQDKELFRDCPRCFLGFERIFCLYASFPHQNKTPQTTILNSTHSRAIPQKCSGLLAFQCPDQQSATWVHCIKGDWRLWFSVCACSSRNSNLGNAPTGPTYLRWSDISTKNAEKIPPPARNSGLPEFIPRKYPENPEKDRQNTKCAPPLAYFWCLGALIYIALLLNKVSEKRRNLKGSFQKRLRNWLRNWPQISNAF